MKGRRDSLLRLSVFAVIVLCATRLFAQSVTVEAHLDTNQALIGDQVALHFTFTGPAGAQILWPRIPDTIFNNLQVIERGKPDTTYSQDRKTATISQRLLLTSFDSGFYSLPPIPFYYRVLPDTTTRVAETRMLLLDVQTVAVDTTRAIKPIKGPVRIPLTFREILPWILLALGIAAVAGFIIYYLRRRKKHEPIFNLIPKVEMKPHEIALAALEELRQKKIWQAGRFKEYHSELTDILRRYIEDRFAVRAMESTTDEILDGLHSGGEVKDDNLRQLRKILILADLVKFAKFLPLGGENEESLDLGTRFVQETKPVQVKEEKTETR
jgi:hypothetical protein